MSETTTSLGNLNQVVTDIFNYKGNATHDCWHTVRKSPSNIPGLTDDYTTKYVYIKLY